MSQLILGFRTGEVGDGLDSRHVLKMDTMGFSCFIRGGWE